MTMPAATGSNAPRPCPGCGAAAGGNFCAVCGTDLRPPTAGLLGSLVESAGRDSYVTVYLQLLGAPIRGVIARAEDPSYRRHLAFLLTSIGMFAAVFIPTLFRVYVSSGREISAERKAWAALTSQLGIYIGTAITIVMLYYTFRLIARERKPFRQYLKLWAIWAGFMLPIYALMHVVVQVLGDDMRAASMLVAPGQGDGALTPAFLLALGTIIVLIVYGAIVHARYWRVAMWKAVPAYLAANVGAYHVSYWVAFYVAVLLSHIALAVGYLRA